MGECEIWLAARAKEEDLSAGKGPVVTLEAGLGFALPGKVLAGSVVPAEDLARLAAVDARGDCGAITAETRSDERYEEPVQLCASDCVG
jgi:hypothetical protein